MVGGAGVLARVAEVQPHNAAHRPIASAHRPKARPHPTHSLPKRHSRLRGEGHAHALQSILA